MTTAAFCIVTEVAMSLVRLCTMTIFLVRLCLCMCLRARERERKQRSRCNAGDGSGLCKVGASSNSHTFHAQAAQGKTMSHISQLPHDDSSLMHSGPSRPGSSNMELESVIGFFSPTTVMEECKFGLQEQVPQGRLPMGLRWLLKAFVDKGQDAPCEERGAPSQTDDPQVFSQDLISGTAYGSSFRKHSTSELPLCTIAWSESGPGSCSVAREMQEQASAEEKLGPRFKFLEKHEDGKREMTADRDEIETQSSLGEGKECCSELQGAYDCSQLPNQTLSSSMPGHDAANQCRRLHASRTEENFEASTIDPEVKGIAGLYLV